MKKADQIKSNQVFVNEQFFMSPQHLFMLAMIQRIKQARQEPPHP